MLNSPKLTLVQELIAGASREELIWLSGYLAGIVANAAPVAPAALTVPTAHPTPSAPGISRITIAYGTESGNSKKLATDFAAKAKRSGISAKLVGLEQYRLNDLQAENSSLRGELDNAKGELISSMNKLSSASVSEQALRDEISELRVSWHSLLNGQFSSDR